MRPDSIDYDQFRIDADGKTLYWTPGDKTILITTTRGGVQFLALPTLASRYGACGIDALQRSLGLYGYTSGTSRIGLSSSALKALQQADTTLPSNLENIKFEDLPVIAHSARRCAEQDETTLTTIGDQQIDTAWVTQVRRELAELEKAMAGVRDG